MGGFNINKFAETLGDVSKLDTSSPDGKEQIEYIDIDRIGSDPNNFYALSELEKLAANIELLGLQQPLRVRADPQDPQRVIIVSGHRRRAALQLLVEDGRKDFREVPCIRERTEGSAALQELRLICANSSTRTLTPAEISRQAARVKELVYLLKGEGLKFPGRMRDFVAEACRISGPKLARLEVIRKKLIPGYMALFEKDELSEQTAYALARLPAEFQERMASVLKEPPTGKRAEKILEKYKEGWRWNPNLTCPDGKACKRGDAFLRRDCESGYWISLCGGQTCCLDCEQATASYSPCERMCSKAKAQRKDAKAEKEARVLRKQRKQGRMYQKKTQGYAKRLLRAIDAAGLTEDTEIPWKNYRIQPLVSTIRQWAADEFNDPANWDSPELVPDQLDNPARLARLLGCSADFLLGLTDDLRPLQLSEPPQTPLDFGSEAPSDAEFQIDSATDLDASPQTGQLCLSGWMPGGTKPFGPCDAVADFNCSESDDVDPIRLPCTFDGQDFCHFKSGLRIDLPCIRWMVLPPVEEP